MLCLKVANNETNDYRTCQSLFDFIKLSISPTEKEPIRILNKSSNVTNKSVIFKKKVNCNNCVKLLKIHEAGHRANSKDCPLNNTNWINKHWNQWQLQLSNEFGNINNNEYLNLVKYKIRECNKHEMIKFRNDLICFYSVHNSEITMVSNLYSYFILNIIESNSTFYFTFSINRKFMITMK